MNQRTEIKDRTKASLQSSHLRNTLLGIKIIKLNKSFGEVERYENGG